MPILHPSQFRQLSHLEILARQVVEGFLTGLHKSPFHGFSVEFSEHRAYNPGESTRHVDWKLLARTDKYYVKRYEEETNLRCQLVIDTSSSMFFPKVEDDSQEMNKARFAACASACLMQLLAKQRDAVGLTLVDDKIELHTRAKSSPVHISQIYQHLDQLFDKQADEAARQTNLAECIDELAERLPRRSLVIFFSDWLEPNVESLFQKLQRLKFQGHEVVFFHLMDKEMEDEFALDNRPYQLIDPESGETLRIQPGLVREKYLEQWSAHKLELRNLCLKNKVDYVEAKINEGFVPVIQQYLHKRQKLL